MKTCQNCTREIQDTFLFCPNCGSDLGKPIICKKCNYSNEPNSKFCPTGASVPQDHLMSIKSAGLCPELKTKVEYIYNSNDHGLRSFRYFINASAKALSGRMRFAKSIVPSSSAPTGASITQASFDAH